MKQLFMKLNTYLVVDTDFYNSISFYPLKYNLPSPTRVNLGN